jgi:hypothetical protein
MSLRTPDLWERALDARRREKVNASARKMKPSGPHKAGEPKPPRPPGSGRRRGATTTCRKHPFTKVGDRFGALRVVAVLPRGHNGRSDERVEVVCPRGHRRESFVFKLRERPTCRRCPRSKS